MREKIVFDRRISWVTLIWSIMSSFSFFAVCMLPSERLLITLIGCSTCFCLHALT